MELLIYEYDNLTKIFFEDRTNMSFSKQKYGPLFTLIINQVIKEKIKIRNPYKVNSDGSVCMFYYYQKENKILEFLLDYEDWVKYRHLYWTYTGSGYVFCRGDKTRKKIYLHREIMGIGEFESLSEVVDHKNRVKTDNRKSNLRVVSQRENIFNLPFKSSKNTTTGIRGLSCCTNWKRKVKGANFRVRVSMLDGTIYTGWFKTKEEALKILLEKRKENGFCA